jgi:hypothetical protein
MKQEVEVKLQAEHQTVVVNVQAQMLKVLFPAKMK